MSLELGKVYSEIDEFCSDIIDTRTDLGLEKLEELTPEDTFQLQKSNQRSEVDKVGTILQTRIFNDSEYAEYVESSITPKSYYKNGGRRKGASPFMSGKGANMFKKVEKYLYDL